MEESEIATLPERNNQSLSFEDYVEIEEGIDIAFGHSVNAIASSIHDLIYCT